MDDEVRMVNENLDTSCWLAYIGTCNRIITLLTGWPMGENEEAYIDGLDANETETDRASQLMLAIAFFRGMILTFIPLCVEWWKWEFIAVWFLVVVMFWATEGLISFPRGMFSEVDLRFASSLHALFGHHVDPPELPPKIADSRSLHGRNVAIAAAMNTPTAFNDVKYMQGKRVLNILTNKLLEFNYSPEGCSPCWEWQNQDGVAKLSKLSLDLTIRQQFPKFRPQFSQFNTD